MTRRILIHIGMMKAASSWFQHSLSENRHVTRVVANQLDPHIGQMWQDDPRGGLSNGFTETLRRALAERLATIPGDVVVTSERLLKGAKGRNVEALYFERLGQIADAFAALGEPVQVMAFTRAPDAWISSVYQQMIKTGQFHGTFPALQDSWRDFLTGPLSFDRVGDIFRERLGDSGFMAMPSEVFRSQYEVGFGWIEDFSGLSLKIKDAKRLKTNPSVDPMEIELIRWVHRFRHAYARSAGVASENSDVRVNEMRMAFRRFVGAAVEPNGRHHAQLRDMLKTMMPGLDIGAFTPDAALLAEVRGRMSRTLANPRYDDFRDLYLKGRQG